MSEDADAGDGRESEPASDAEPRRDALEATDSGDGPSVATRAGSRDGSGERDAGGTGSNVSDDSDPEDPATRRARPDDGDGSADGSADPAVSDDVRRYARFQKMDGAQYDRVNEFLRDRTYITAREWAIARLCSDFRTETGVEMTKIGENLPELVPFMTDTYTPQAVNQARASFEEKIRMAGATFLYGAMCDFFTAEELDDVMYEATEVAKFLLEVEGVDLTVDEELEAEERISAVMREVREASEELREREEDEE